MKQKEFIKPFSWHFIALYHKEKKKYTNSMKFYLQALKNHPSIRNVLRYLLNLQLYQRQFYQFSESARKDLMSNLGYLYIRWLILLLFFLWRIYKFILRGLEVSNQRKWMRWFFSKPIFRLSKINQLYEVFKFLKEKNKFWKKIFQEKNLRI